MILGDWGQIQRRQKTGTSGSGQVNANTWITVISRYPCNIQSMEDIIINPVAGQTVQLIKIVFGRLADIREKDKFIDLSNGNVYIVECARPRRLTQHMELHLRGGVYQ